MPKRRKEERLPSNRRALLAPDPLVDGIVRQELEAIKRIEQTFPADMDPLARDLLVGQMVGHNVLHWMTVQSLLAYPEDQASAQQEAPAQPQQQESSPTLLYPDRMTLKQAAAYAKVSVRTLNYERAEGRLPFLKVGPKRTKVLLEKVKVDVWLKSQQR